MLNKFFKTKYRVIRDTYLGYEAQYKPWWSPFWLQINNVNTSWTLKQAMEYIQKHKNPCVWEETGE